MKKLNAMSCLFAVFAASGASAQNFSDGDWTGFYAGLQIGYHDLEYRSPVVPGGVASDGSGETWGLHAGYSHDFGRFVIGTEASVDFSTTELNVTRTGRLEQRDVKRMASLKAIAGYDAGRFMPYAAIGHTWQDTQDTSGRGNDVTFTGLTYGIGVNVLLRENLMAGLELMRFDLNPKTSRSLLTVEGAAINLRLSYRF